MKTILQARVFFLFIAAFITLGIYCCKDNSGQYRKYRTIIKDGLTFKGYVINDSIFDDTIYCYNAENTLMSKSIYSKGKLNGISEDYYKKTIKSRTNYSYGMKNGKNCYYDSLGNLLYSDNYYYDLPVGPVAYYGVNNIVKRFFFISFDNRTLLDIDYSAWKGVDDYVLNFINYSYEFQKIDSTKEASLFLYIISPPKILAKYSLFKKSRSDNKEQEYLTTFSTKQPFVSYSLPVINDDDYYSIQLEIYDSIINKRSIINREVW